EGLNGEGEGAKTNGDGGNPVVEPSSGAVSPAPHPASPSPGSARVLPPPLAPPAQRHFVPERYLLRFTVGRDTHDKLRYAPRLSSHSNPGGSSEPIRSEALDLWIAHREKQRFAATTRPRPRFKAAARNVRSAPAKAAAGSPANGSPDGSPGNSPDGSPV